MARTAAYRQAKGSCCHADMPRRARVTQAAICQAIRAAKQTQAGLVRILPDGTICIDPQPSPPIDIPDPGQLASKWEDAAPPRSRRRFGERLGANTGSDDPLATALARWQRGDLNTNQLPPGRYPNGMRVYADGEWEAIVRNKPLGKREVTALKAYFEADGSTNFYCGGPDTNDRLEVRGLIEKSAPAIKDRMPFYRITAAGRVERLKQLEALAARDKL